MSEAYTMKQAAEQVQNFIVANCPRQYLRGTIDQAVEPFLKYEFLGNIFLQWESCFGVDCSMTFNMDGGPNISWGGMQRGVLTASASVALYRQVVDFALQLEAFRLQQLSYVKRSNKKR